MYAQAAACTREITCCTSNSHMSNLLSAPLECFFFFFFLTQWNFLELKMAELKPFVVLSQALIVISLLFALLRSYGL